MWTIKSKEIIVIDNCSTDGTREYLNKLKDETFYVQSGEILLRYGGCDDLERSKTINLKPGDKFYVPPGLRHQMTGLADTELFEFSTQHFEDDSYRVIRGD